MSRRKTGGNTTLPEAANDNIPAEGPAVRKVEVLLPENMPILQVEVEVFAALLDDWPVANDNEEP
jgi:hypothetical protein